MRGLASGLRRVGEEALLLDGTEFRQNLLRQVVWLLLRAASDG